MGSPVDASQRRISRSVPPVSSVRLSGRNAADQHGQPRPDQRALERARCSRSMMATAPRMPAAATSLPSPETASAMIGMPPPRPRRPARPPARGSRPCRRRRRQRSRRPRATATALSGVGRVTTMGEASPDSGQMRSVGIVAGRDEAAAVGREGDAVDVLLMAFEHARRPAGKRPHARGVIPDWRTRASPRRAKRQARRPAPCGPRSTMSRLGLARSPDRNAGVLAAGGDAPILQEDDRIHRAFVEAQHLLGRAGPQRPADGGGVEAAGDGAAFRRRRSASARTGPP